MKRLLFLLCVSILTVQCSNDEDPAELCPCGTSATIRDLSGLDGCGYVFELEHGTRIEPVIVFYCGTGLPENEKGTTPQNFEWKDGMKVKIDYELATDQTSACMAGQLAWIRCVCAVPETQEPQAQR